MAFTKLACLFVLALAPLSSAEFYSDVDSKEHDEAKALEIKAKDFWQGLMDSADGLKTTDNARLCAEVDQALETLPPEQGNIREMFLSAIGHLATADAMLFEEASTFKKLALQRLENGPSKDSFFDSFFDPEDSFFSAVTRFIGYKTYEKRLAQHIVGRMKDMASNIDRVVDMVPQMLAESSKAADLATEILRTGRRKKGGDLPRHLQSLCHKIRSATGKQRKRVTSYMFSTVMTMATDNAGRDDRASNTIVQSSLQGLGLDANSAQPAVQYEAEMGQMGHALTSERPAHAKPIGLGESGLIRMSAPVLSGVEEPKSQVHGGSTDSGLMRKENVQSKPMVRTETQKPEVRTSSAPEGAVGAEPPLVFFDGVPVDAKPVAGYASNAKEVVDV